MLQCKKSTHTGTLAALAPFRRLNGVFERVKESRTIGFRESGVKGLRAGGFAQMAMQIAHAERHADALFGERLAGGAETAAPFFRQRDASGMSAVIAMSFS